MIETPIDIDIPQKPASLAARIAMVLPCLALAIGIFMFQAVARSPADWQPGPLIRAAAIAVPLLMVVGVVLAAQQLIKNRQVPDMRPTRRAAVLALLIAMAVMTIGVFATPLLKPKGGPSNDRPSSHAMPVQP